MRRGGLTTNSDKIIKDLCLIKMAHNDRDYFLLDIWFSWSGSVKQILPQMCYLGLLANWPEDQELVEFIFLLNKKKTENTVEFFF